MTAASPKPSVESVLLVNIKPVKIITTHKNTELHSTHRILSLSDIKSTFKKMTPVFKTLLKV